MKYQQPIPPLWLFLWVPLLACAWLLPNHYYPWATFHTDAWVATMFIIAAGAVFIRIAGRVEWHGLSILIALLALIPFAQFFVGKIHFSGVAWVCTAYILGFLLSLLMGARWEAATPGRAADGLFLAIGIAALISVGLQLRQWLGLAIETDAMQIWAGEYSPGRPAANLGQPNQLGTLLLWSLAACGWGVVRKKIQPIYAIAAALFLLFGLALTQSRIAIIAVLMITLAAWAWRRIWASPRVPSVVTLLCVYFGLCIFALQYISDFLGLGIEIRSASMGGASTNLRLQAYRLFLDAAWQQPLWGYGWNQVAVAQLAVAQEHPNLTSFFIQSHNLFLDLVLWCGIPIGGTISAYLIIWFLQCIKRIASAEDAILIAFILIVGLHAMVELPLHHAYFLLPTGLVMGILNQRLRHRVLASTGRIFIFSLLATTTLIFSLIVQDYLRVDASFRTYRLEVARIGTAPPGEAPDVLLLNDLHAFIRNARADVKKSKDDSELEELWRITTSFPTPSNMFNYAKVLALSGKPEAAKDWILKIQHVLPDLYTRELENIWISQGKENPAMALVQWPPLPIKDATTKQ